MNYPLPEQAERLSCFGLPYDPLLGRVGRITNDTVPNRGTKTQSAYDANHLSDFRAEKAPLRSPTTTPAALNSKRGEGSYHPHTTSFPAKRNQSIVAHENPSRPSPTGCSASLDRTSRAPLQTSRFWRKNCLGEVPVLQPKSQNRSIVRHAIHGSVARYSLLPILHVLVMLSVFRFSYTSPRLDFVTHCVTIPPCSPFAASSGTPGMSPTSPDTVLYLTRWKKVCHDEPITSETYKGRIRVVGL